MSLAERRTVEFGKAIRPEWPLDPDVVYLNHGTVGVAPKRALEAQDRIRHDMDRRPAQFLLRELSEVAVGVPRAEPPLLRRAADRVARFLNAEGKDLVFVDNATTGINAVLRSLPFRGGDEIAISDHAYGAIRNVAAFRARETGAHVRDVLLPGPPYAERGIADAYVAALTPRTRLLIVDHLTSESALILPLAEIVAAAHGRGVMVLVDGAHAPGAIPVDLRALAEAGADWYAANLHKWAYAPRSCGVLWAAPHRQEGLHPAVISWGIGRGFTAQFDWVGTRDPSAWLAAPVAIEYLEELGADRVREHNTALARRARSLLTERWGTEPAAPESMTGPMTTIPVPLRLGGTPEEAARHRDRLLFEHRIEVQMHAWRERIWVRVSAQVYNDMEDLERLAAAVAALPS